MSTITAVLDCHEDGTLHLPLPEELRGKKVRVTVTMEAEGESTAPAEVEETLPLPDMSKIKTPLDALKEIRKRGGLSHIIPDPVAWQREIREDRQLPGRE
jgi:hypothetical protein